MLVPLFFMMGGGDLILGIYGAGGFGRETREIFECDGTVDRWDEIIFIDDVIAKETDRFKGARIVTFERFSKEFSPAEAKVLVTIGEPQVKIALFEKVARAGFMFADLIHRRALISPSATIGCGVTIRAFATVSTEATVEDCAAVFEYAGIGHDSVIKKYAHLAPGVMISGACSVGVGTYIGVGAVVREGVKIGNNTVVGMGAVVYNDIPDNVIAMGNPARPMKHKDDSRVFK